MNNAKGIYSNRCWIEGKLQPATIYYKDGVISLISKERGKEPEVEDFGNKVIMPGVIDAHVHINEPGRTDWEGFDTGTQAAAAGGITTIVDMPLNASPVTITKAALEQKLSFKRKASCQLWFLCRPCSSKYKRFRTIIAGWCFGCKSISYAFRH